MEPTLPTSPGGIGELHKSPKFQKEKVMASIKNIIGYGGSRTARSESLPMDTPFEDGGVESNQDTKKLRSGWRFGVKNAKAGLRSAHSQDALESPHTRKIQGCGHSPFLDHEDHLAISETKKVGPLRSKFSLDGQNENIREKLEDKVSPMMTIISTKDGDIIPCKTIEQIALAQKAYLDNLLDEEIRLYGKFECDSKLEARGIYLKNLQEEEAKLFALPQNLNAMDVFIENLQGQEREEDTNSGVWQNEPNLPKVDKDAKLVGKLKLPQVFLSPPPPPCPSPQMHKAIIASRPLALISGSSAASFQGDREDSNLASLQAHFQVMENGPVPEENTIAKEHTRSPLEQERECPDGSGVPNIDPEFDPGFQTRGGVHTGVGTDEEWRSILVKEGVVVLKIDPRYQREGVHRAVGTDEQWSKSNSEVSEELEVSTQTDPEEVVTAPQHLDDSEGGRQQVKASVEKNLAELDAAIVHVRAQEEKMAKICSERAGVCSNCNQSPILSRLAQAMGQSAQDEDLESDVDSDDDLLFYETQEEFPELVDDLDGASGSYANSDVETSSHQDDVFPSVLPGDPSVERRGTSRHLGWFNSNYFRGLETSTSLVSAGKSSSSKSNFTDEELETPSILRQPRGSWGIHARLLAGARDENTQPSREIYVNNSGYCNEELSTRPLRRRNSSSSAIRARLSAVTSGKSSGQVPWEASENDITYPKDEFSKRRLVRSLSNNEAMLAKLSELSSSDDPRSKNLPEDFAARNSSIYYGRWRPEFVSSDDQRSKDVPSRHSIREDNYNWKPVRRDSSNTAILARLSAVAQCEGIEPYSTKSSSCDNEELFQEKPLGRRGSTKSSSWDNEEIFQEKPVSRRGSSSSAILGRLSEVVGNKDTRPSPEETSLQINSGDNIEDQHMRPPWRRGSSSSGTVILARLSTIVSDNRSSRSSQQSSEDIVASGSSNPREELLKAPARKQSISGGSGSATLDRFSRSSSAQFWNSQQSSDLSPLNRFSNDGSDDVLRVLPRRRSSGKCAKIPSMLFEFSREETSQEPFRNVRGIVGNSGSKNREFYYGEFCKTPGSRRDCNDYGELYKTPASRRGSSCEAILSRLSDVVGTKQISGDQNLETQVNQLEPKHEDTLALARVEVMQQLKRASTGGSCRNYRTKVTEGNNDSAIAVTSRCKEVMGGTSQQEFRSARCTEVIDGMRRQESPNANGTGRQTQRRIPEYDWNNSYKQEVERGVKSTGPTSGGERSTVMPDLSTADGYNDPDLMRSPTMNIEVEDTCLLARQDREIKKALEQLRRESLGRMSALEHLQVPDFDELARKQYRTRKSIARIRKLMSEDTKTTKDKKEIVLGEHLIDQDNGCSGQTEQRRNSEKKKIEVQRTWVALVEERGIAKALDELSKEIVGRITSKSLAPP